MARILIVDDDASFRESLAETLASIGHETLLASSGKECLALAGSETIDAVFLDFRLPDMTGLQVLRELRRTPAGSSMTVIMLTAYATVDNTIEAMKLGAFDHLAKPSGRQVIERALDEALRSRSTAGAAGPAARPGEFIANGPAMREVVKRVGRAAATDVTVLITGETGTGKEEVARALHRHGARADQPFVAINCSAIPRDLMESELFGHERGAFTGAVTARVGIFRQADRGTLLLDEIGDMSADLQAKLLRALQERAIVPVGATRPITVDVRIVAATHRDLREEIRNGRFREDLYHRLNVLHIDIPPLRERGEDIGGLADHFLSLASDPPKSLSAEARQRLEQHAWPGNVRELKNVIERATILSRGACIEPADLGLEVPGAGSVAASSDETLPAAMARIEESMIRNALLEVQGNRTLAARRLGIHRQLLYAKLRQYGIER